MKTVDLMESQEDSSSLDVIIIGGGIAGISAARHLLKNGVDKILVIEAQDYLGGRIKTLQTDYGHIDLGAEWIHGQQGNPLYDLAVCHQLVHKRRQSFYISHSAANLYDEQEQRTENGDILSKTIVTEVSNVMENLYELSLVGALSTTKNGEKPNDVTMKKKSQKMASFASHFAEGFDRYLADCNHDGSDDEKIKSALYRWRLKWELTDNCCESLEDVAFPGRYLVFEGQGITDLKAGFQTVFDILKVDVPEKNIKLNKPIKVIKWNQGLNSVECFDGSIYKTKYIIVTVPIGYLKENMTTMFSPPLPERKLLSIRNCGFSTTVKLFFVWETPFWDHAFRGVQFVWVNNKVEDCIRDDVEKEKTDKLKTDGNPWYIDLTGFERCIGRPNILSSWIAGEGASLSVRVSDRELTQVGTALLRKFCNNNSIPEPVKVYRSKWESNPYIRGGYSYVSVRENEWDYDALCESLPSNKNPRVLFAGEATSFNYYSTTHGAYETGIRAAETIIKTEVDMP